MTEPIDSADQVAGTTPDAPDAPAPARWWRVGGTVRQDVRTAVAVHERFVRDTAAVLSRVTRCEAELSVVASEWMSVGEYLACLGDRVVVAQVELPGAPTGMLVGLEAGIGLQIIDRLLGGSGGPAPERGPTELELDLLGDVVAGPVAGVGEVFGPVLRAAPQIAQVTPQLELLRAGSLTAPALVMTYRIGLSLAVPAAGLLTLCYPAEVVDVLLSVVGQPAQAPAPSAPPGAPVLRQLVEDVEMDLVASLQPSAVPAEDLRQLRVGDVLILDHHRDDAIDLAIGGTVVLDGALGRRSRAVAVQVRQWRVTPDALIKEFSQ